MATLLIVGKGGFGDMMPLWAVAGELKQRGHRIVVAAERHHRPACRSLGVELIVLRPSRHPLAAPRDEEIHALLPLAQQTDLVLVNQLAYSGPLAAELARTPWVYCAASPLAMPSRYDPPYWPVLNHVQRLAPRWAGGQRGALAIARGATALVMQAHARQRRRFGLTGRVHPRFEGLYSPYLNLLMASPLLASAQPDWPANTLVTGFCPFEPTFLGNAAQRDALEHFVAAGMPPVLIAPGGRERAQPEAMLKRLIMACQALGERAVIVLSPRFHHLAPRDEHLFVTGYMPYSELIEASRAVIHSGGIGTIGWALRLGKSSLLLPSEWDQFDNARRATAAGYALTRIPGGSEQQLAQALLELRDSGWFELKRDTVAASTEDGTTRATNAIESLL